MVASQELRFKCIKCGKCCSDSNTIVNVTYFDILRIQKGLSLTINELLHVLGFYIFKEDLSLGNREKMIISPINTEKGLAFTGLYKKENGDCYFFDNKAKECSIYNLRPLFCRTFPFSFKAAVKKEQNQKPEIKIFYSKKGKEYCLGMKDDAPLINLDKWLELGTKVLKILKQNEKIIQNYNLKIEKGELKPTAKNFLKYLVNLSDSNF